LEIRQLFTARFLEIEIHKKKIGISEFGSLKMGSEKTTFGNQLDVIFPGARGPTRISRQVPDKNVDSRREIAHYQP
jgi:hypothetical protein